MDYADFGPNIDAHLIYTSTLPQAEALERLRRLFDDGSWRSSPGPWLHHVCMFVHRYHLGDDPGVVALRAALVAALLEGKLGPEAHHTLLMLVDRNLLVTTAEAGALARWFVERAEPSDASLAADVLHKVLMNRSALGDALAPLVPWLAQNGAGELRARRRGELLLRLVGTFSNPDRDASLIPALLRYVVLNDEPLGAHHAFRREPAHFLCAMERALADDRHQALAAEVALKMGEELLARAFDPAGTYPRVQASLLRALARGAWPAEIASKAWELALACACPPALTFRTAAAVDLAMVALRSRAGTRSFVPHGPGGGHRDREWTRLVVGEYLRIYDVPSHTTQATRDRLRDVAGSDEIAPGVAEPLKASLDAAPGVRLSRSILAEGTSGAHVLAAIAALPDSGGPSALGSGEFDEAGVVSLLTRLIARPWVAPIFGVDLAAALGSATRVELATLDDEWKVRIADGVARLDRSAVRDMLSALRMNAEEKLALAAMYFVHELVHIAQGIGDKALVSALRSTGAETTLMHVDLGADHVAALAVADTFAKWSLEWLKDLAGRSTLAFPASPYGTAASRARKSQRLVGLRLDYLVRRHGRVPAGPGLGYAFAEHGPAGGPLLVMMSGPPVRLVANAMLSKDEAALLSGAMGDGLDEARLGEVDRILLGALGERE